jgi:hypothetical protein
MRPFPRRLAIVAVVAMMLVIPGSVAAFPLTNCTLEITSLDIDGNVVDSASGGGADATQDDPLIIDWDGDVLWSGTTGGQVIKNNSWHVDVFGFPTPLRGGDPNDAGTTDGVDRYDVSASAPFRLTGLFFVSGEFTGEGGSCTGSGWFKIAGEPVGSVPFWLAIVLIVLGAILIAVAARGGWVPGLLGGLLFGVGVAGLLVGLSTLPLGSLTVPVTIVLGVLIGALAAWTGRSRARATTPAA